MVDGVVDIPLWGQPPGCDLTANRDRNSCRVHHEFVVGPENRLVETVVRSVLEDSKRKYRPLVVYGPTGTGKSHLARGLAAQWKNRFPSRTVVSTSAVDFSRELADAIETQDMQDFRARYRKARLLVFEDLGRLAGKRAAQEELIYTLDALLTAGRQVVLTAAAARLPELMPALQSRLIAGLTVPLVPPAPETRLVILQRLAKLREIELSEPVARVLAQGLSTTVPELLGALIQLETQARLQGIAIDAQAARIYLVRRNGLRQPGLRDLAAATARYFSLKLSELRSPSRRRAVVTARGVAMYLARQLSGKSLEQIGRYFGGRDHTTVMHGCRKTAELLKTDPTVTRAIQQLQENW